ncbi:MAG TPA: response regulator [Blastocatellia bacterium]|jgi:Response regulators consisting of a CheY-like receiver domain and a winged-helix DNA-binding domain
MHKLKILIVDDDPDIADALTLILQSAEYDVISAATGQECLQIARAERPDLILLDVRLPDINGLEVCRRIKTDPELARIAVINVTGMRTSKDDEVEGIEAGADAYLTKPVHLRTLLAHMQTLLRARQTETTREIESLEQFPRLPHASVAAQSLGLTPLRESLPDLFDELVQHYGDLLDQALEQRVYKVNYQLAESLRALGDQLGFIKAGPRDVVQIHHAALLIKAANVTGSKARAYIEEGRMLILELMGNLVSYYRNYTLSVREGNTSDSRKVEAGRRETHE